MAKILLVEDDRNIASGLSEYLQEAGYETENVRGQREALKRVNQGGIDLILMDVSLEEGNGFSACAEIRRISTTPIIFLTASGDEGSVVAGLEIGADDYIAKPFRPRELISRIKTCLRRNTAESNRIQLGNVTVDPDRGIVTKDGQEISLSALEYRILLVFAGNRGKLLSRSRLLEEIWDIAGDYVNDNTLTVYIKRIREKIEEDPQNPKIIQTIRGLGYRVD